MKKNADAARQLTDYLAYAKRRYTAPTYKAYSSVLRELLDFTGGIPWGEVPSSRLEAFIDRPRRTKTGKASHATVQRDAAVVRTYYRWLDDERLIDRNEKNPAARLVPEKGLPTAKREPVPDDLWKAIWGAEFVTGDDRLWLGLGYFCGLRVAEMASLQPLNVRPRSQRVDPGTLKFFRKGSKSDEGIAYAVIIDLLTDPDIGLPELAENGEAWMDLLENTATFRSKEMFLLPSSVGDVFADTHAIWRRLRAIQRKLDVSEDQLISPHNLRHSAATNLAMCQVPADVIQRQLSHSSPAITAHYTGKAAQRMTRWLDQQRRDNGTSR